MSRLLRRWWRWDGATPRASTSPRVARSGGVAGRARTVGAGAGVVVTGRVSSSVAQIPQPLAVFAAAGTWR
ncbi:MAG: hypothetical protein KatS3mg010_1454 [Acidimicrobiia bacterium]|nr:MAG: hypothetical protein KatS3mg010_1454 [Acidimicrobiia bacterium]